MLATGVAHTVADLIAIDTVLTKGELTVQFADRSVTYRSVDQLLKARAFIQDQIDSTTGTPRPRQTVGVASKGL